MRSARTYFEQIPVEAVKRIIERRPDKKDIESDEVIAETPAGKTEPYSVGIHLICRKGL